MATTPVRPNVLSQGAVAANAVCFDMANSMYLFGGTAAPSNGTSGTGAGWAGPGSIYMRSNGTQYRQTGTLASPTWT